MGYVPTRRERVRFFSVATAENAASCEVRGFDFDGTFSTFIVSFPNSPWTRISCTFSLPPGTATMRTRTGTAGSTANRSEAATFEVAGNARAASSAVPSKMTASSLKPSSCRPRYTTYFDPCSAAIGFRLVSCANSIRPMDADLIPSSPAMAPDGT